MSEREKQELLKLISFLKPQIQNAAGQLVVHLNLLLQLALDAGFEKLEETIEALPSRKSGD